MSAYSFFIGWAIIFLLFWGGTKFEGTKTLIYYVLWLSIILAIVANYKQFTSLLGGVNESVGSNVTNNLNSTTSTTSIPITTSSF